MFLLTDRSTCVSKTFEVCPESRETNATVALWSCHHGLTALSATQSMANSMFLIEKKHKDSNANISIEISTPLAGSGTLLTGFESQVRPEF